ncbi:Stp1/IreP family PP2C-type Ser/Thr phosphatase [Paenibacillus thalictri]|uniref:Stp1/IreP family PP2C-type Ser/Thr phosphatase n=1 Tax=Paenibacillus thalictri TaxID=2527873 RepID=A0A4Q9DUF5_9BACL|nr:Stp1/IreP family PP2C-type Ser/Thr phosphatase [Paenibacillus thalictri]TBL78337.1 Stp1/IreP family PP2C-type Ser/Thr phosphatase [Paenibacillus thalictri]
MNIAFKTDIGRVRAVNEDSVLVRHDVGGYALAIVADGMGGHQAGDLASQMAIDMIREELRPIHTGMSKEQCKQAIQAAIENANRDIFEFASNREEYHGMGTTVVAVAASGDYAVIGHVGDSRAYKINSESMEQLTEDHSLVNELVKSGQITREEASHHPRRNVVTRALGTEPTIKVDVLELNWQQGDMLLLCSDGLSSLVRSDVIFDIVLADSGLEDKVERLVGEALAAGGDDNISVILIANDTRKQDRDEMG